jgi:hypothetical protein
MKKGKAKKDIGIFGKPVTLCSAVEEQGWKVLHRHILMWIKDWMKLYEGLGNTNEALQKRFETQLSEYAQKSWQQKLWVLMRVCISDRAEKIVQNIHVMWRTWKKYCFNVFKIYAWSLEQYALVTKLFINSVIAIIVTQARMLLFRN